MLIIESSGREISEEVAAQTDRQNEFPADMWKKLGEAGWVDSTGLTVHGLM